LLEAIELVCNPLLSNQLTIRIAISTQMDGPGFESRQDQQTYLLSQ
jgi:hypothetical protein